MFVDIPIVVSSLWSPRSTRSVSTTTLLTALSSMMLRTPVIVSAISTKTSLPTTSQSALDRVHQSQILSTAYSLSSHSWLTLSASSILAHSSYPSNPVSTLSTQLSPEEHRLFTTLFSLVIGLLVLAIILTTILIIIFGMRCVKRCLAIKQENKRPVIRKFLRNNVYTHFIEYQYTESARLIILSVQHSTFPQAFLVHVQQLIPDTETQLT